jgi:hypothetical protein
MMSWFLGDVERFLERAVETPARRLLRSRLQPVELARALGRAMSAESQVGPLGLQVPNRYRIVLHPDDFAEFESWRGALENELAAYVAQRSQARGWRCPGRPHVVLDADPAAPRGRPLIETATEDAAPDALDSPGLAAAAGVPATDRTAVLVRPAARTRPEAWLELPDGGTVRLTHPRLRLGRAADNDLVIEHESVSRHHAEVRRVDDQYVLVDLASTNGTRVEGEIVQQRPLRSRETVHIGAVPLRFHRPS